MTNTRVQIAVGAALALGLAAVIYFVAIRGRGPHVEVVTLRPEPVSQILAVVGRAQPVETVEIRPQSAGLVVRMLVDEGATVAAGQILAEIDPAEQNAALARAQADAAGRSAEAVARQGEVSGRQADVARSIGEVSARQGEVAGREADLAARRADLVRQEADLAGRRATAELARAELARTRLLHGRGFASQAALDQADAAAQSADAAVRTAQAGVAASTAIVRTAAAAVETARAGVRAAEAGVAAARASVGSAASTAKAAGAGVVAAQAGVREAATRAGRLALRAPMAGVVLARPIDPGQFADPQTVVFRVGAGGPPEIEAEIDEADADRLRVGMKAVVSPTGTMTRHAARITEISPAVDPGTGGRLIRLVPDDAKVAFAPGRTVDVNIVLADREARLLAPRAALIEAGAAVLVVDAEGVVARRAVRLDDWPGPRVSILAGLAAGDRVILRPDAAMIGKAVVPVAPKPEEKGEGKAAP